jgi:hypothetical protein
VTLSTAGEGCGQAAMLSLGDFERV